VILDAAQRQPLVLVLENLHWSDATSAAWLASLVECLGDAAVLVLGTYRPGYQPAWGAHSAVTQVALAPLQARDSRAVVQAVLGAVHFPETRLQKIVVQAAGNPFFLEELAWHTREQGGMALPGAVPETVHAVLAARMDRLPPEAKHLLQTAAVIGPTVPLPLLQAVAEVPEDSLQRSLAHLQATEFLYETRVVPERTYTFKHALTHEVAYQSLLARTRQHYHQRIAQALETLFPDTVATQPAMLAHHYTEAGCPAQAIPYWQRAGQQAIARSSYVEAVALLAKGLTLIEALPDTLEWTQQALQMQTVLGKVLMLTTGYGTPEVEHALVRARALCRREDAAALFPIQTGLQTVALVRAELQTARTLSEQLLHIAQCQQDPVLLSRAYSGSGQTFLFLSELLAARAHLEQGLAYSNSHQYRDRDFRYMGIPDGMRCWASLAWTLWLLGYPEQALTSVHTARALAQQLSYPFCLAYALDFAIGLHQLRREAQVVQTRAEELRTLAQAQALPLWVAWAMVLHGWARTMQAHSARGIAQMWEGLAAWRAAGSDLNRPWLLALIAEAYGQAGQADEGLAVLTEALALVEKTDERWYKAELYRLKGELLLAPARTRDGVEEAEECFCQALSIARHQQARSWELRAAMSLGRLWQRQGQCAAARQLIAEVYGWFTEGFDTADLHDAKVLLKELGI
jgi:tetratricopeptide (TPR) repeat protein